MIIIKKNDLNLLSQQFANLLRIIKGVNESVIEKKNNVVLNYQNILASLRGIVTDFDSTILNQGIYSYANGLAYQENNKVFSTMSAHLLADAAVLAGYAYSGRSQSALTEYTIASTIKYLPNLIIDHFFKNSQAVSTINNLLISNYGPFVFEAAYLAWKYINEETGGKAILLGLGTELGCLVGALAGDKIGKLGATLTNAILQPIYACFVGNNEPDKTLLTNETLNQNENTAKIVINGNVTINQTINNFPNINNLDEVLQTIKSTENKNEENTNKCLRDSLNTSLLLFNQKNNNELRQISAASAVKNDTDSSMKLD